MKKSTGLRPKQQRFVLEYLVDLNATQAALRAGYSKNTAVKQASRLLGIVGIQTAISERQAEMAEKLKITAERVAQEYSVVAFLDYRIFFDKEGNLIPVHQLTDGAAAALAGLETVMVGAGDEVNFVKKIKTYNKLKALGDLAKHLGFFEKNNEQKQPDWKKEKLDPRIADMLNNPDDYMPPVTDE